MEILMLIQWPISRLTSIWCSLLFAMAISTFTQPASCYAADWSEDINAAVEQAAVNDKDLMILYTGSDWCPPCKLLEKEVLSQKDFLNEVDAHYELVKLDFPQQTEQEPEIAQRNAEWAQRFGIEGFPTIVLTDVSLKPYAFLGYEEGGFQNYLAVVEEARQLRIARDEKLKQAGAAEFSEKARLLDEAIGGMKEELVRVYYSDVIEKIVELAPKDEFGLRTKWNGQAEAEIRKMMLADMLMVSRIERPDRAIEFIDDVLNQIEFSDQQKFEALQIKLSLVRQLQEPELVNSLMDEMLAIEGLTDDTRQRLLVKRLLLMVGAGQKDNATEQLQQALEKYPGSPWLLMAKGDLEEADEKFEQAVSTYSLAQNSARANPDLLIDIVGAKADALFGSGRKADALQTLDNFAEDTRMPPDLRAEALLHKSMLMRDMGRTRQARLAENRAIEVAESAQEKAETQKVIEKMRAKFRND
jgi:thioredoxin-related protein